MQASHTESDMDPCPECRTVGDWMQAQVWPARDAARFCRACDRIEVRCPACRQWTGIGIYCAHCGDRQHKVVGNGF